VSNPDIRNSRRARQVCFDTHCMEDVRGVYMICHCGRPQCKKRIDPVKDKWRADHNRRWAEGGRDTPANLWPILAICDLEFKAPRDARWVAKGRRIAKKMRGEHRRKGRPIPGSKDSPFKKLMNGTVVRR